MRTKPKQIRRSKTGRIFSKTNKNKSNSLKKIRNNLRNKKFSKNTEITFGIHKREKIIKEPRTKKQSIKLFNEFKSPENKSSLTIIKSEIRKLYRYLDEGEKLNKIKNKKTKSYKIKQERFNKKIKNYVEQQKIAKSKIRKLKNLKDGQFLTSKIKDNHGRIYYIKYKTQEDFENIINKIVKKQSMLYGKTRIMTSYKEIEKPKVQKYIWDWIDYNAEADLNKQGLTIKNRRIVKINKNKK